MRLPFSIASSCFSAALSQKEKRGTLDGNVSGMVRPSTRRLAEEDVRREQG